MCGHYAANAPFVRGVEKRRCSHTVVVFEFNTAGFLVQRVTGQVMSASQTDRELHTVREPITFRRAHRPSRPGRTDVLEGRECVRKYFHSLLTKASLFFFFCHTNIQVHVLFTLSLPRVVRKQLQCDHFAPGPVLKNVQGFPRLLGVTYWTLFVSLYYFQTIFLH